MNKLLAAVALAIALPGVAHAQAAPSEKPKMDCCEKMKEKSKDCCDEMKKGQHEGHPMQHDGHTMEAPKS